MNTIEPVSNTSVIGRAQGEDWMTLHPVLRQHYGIVPGSDRQLLMTGTMTHIDHSLFAKLLLLPGRIFGALIPYRGTDIPATVRNWTTTTDPQSMFWRRRFQFPQGREAIFASRMAHIDADEIIEYVRFGLGIRMRLSVVHGALVYRSNGYQWDIGRFRLRFPDWLALGTGEIRETGLTDSIFEMSFVMHHPLFGRTFSYAGHFELSQVADDGCSHFTGANAPARSCR